MKSILSQLFLYMQLRRKMLRSVHPAYFMSHKNNGIKKKQTLWCRDAFTYAYVLFVDKISVLVET